SASPGTPRFGPSTLPIAPIHTTRESERARVDGAARSVAAKRAWRLTAVPAPVISSPRNSGTTSSHCAAATSSAAPAEATHQPVARAVRRPRRAARSPSGIPSSAAPRVEEVRARPAQASLSVTSTANRIPIDGVTPRAMVPRICALTSTTRVRRCRGSPGADRAARCWAVLVVIALLRDWPSRGARRSCAHLVHSLYPRCGRQSTPCVRAVIAGRTRPVGRRRAPPLPRLARGADLRDVGAQGRLEALGIPVAEGLEQLGVLGERLLS